MSEFYKFRQSLIYAERSKNIGIQGNGEIYFRGEKRTDTQGDFKNILVRNVTIGGIQGSLHAIKRSFVKYWSYYCIL